VGRLADFLEERTGLASAWRASLERPLPGGARFAYATCAAVAALIGLELVTGLVLSLHYSPGVATAWASVVFFEERIRAGKLVRGLHAFGASALVIALLVHYARVVLEGGYKKPRELTWAAGIAIVLVLAGFAITGTLLPFDQNAYWATRVRMGYAGATPLVGRTLAGVAQGGEDVGNLTLARFYAIHAVLLPGALLALAALRSRLKARHGETPAPSVPETAPATAWYPAQAARNWLVAALVVVGLLAFVHHMGGAPLEGPADPASDYEPRPEWYFLPLFQLVKYFPPQVAFLGTEVVPAALVLALLALPFVDKGESRAPSKRLPALAIAFGPLVLAALLASIAVQHDADNRHLHDNQRKSLEDARDARKLFLANGGIPPEGPLELYEQDPLRVGKRVFQERCAACHSFDGRPMKGPGLGGYLSNAWLGRVIRTPDDPALFGKLDRMHQTDGKPQEIAALVDFVRALESDAAARAMGEARLAAARKVWDEKQCACCHECKAPVGQRGGSRGGGRGGDESDDGSDDDGPNLAGYGSEAWLTDFLKKPDDARFYGKANKMPAYADKLSARELAAVVAYLKNLSKEEN
jgi:ubiquinol-cytochrome c reductase cytochrome b subunit